jgi:MFS family permease
MRKQMITRIWLIGLIVLAVGLVVGGVGLGLMLAYGGAYTPTAAGSAYEFVPTLDAFFWTTTALMLTGFALAAAGAITQFVAWIGAVVNTYQLEDKLWFWVLLAGGLLGLVWGVIPFATMVAYLIAGPDGTTMPLPHRVDAPPNLSTRAVSA